MKKTIELILELADDIYLALPKGIEKRYYQKMVYSGENKTTDVDVEILKKTIAFEISFVHIMVFIFNSCYTEFGSDYRVLLKMLDPENLFSWYSVNTKFVDNNVEEFNTCDFSNIARLINQHDTFIDKEMKKVLGQFYTPSNIIEGVFVEIEKELTSLQNSDLIADPACGTGLFVVRLIDSISKRFEPLQTIQFVVENIYAYDVNPFAIIATKINVLYSLLVKFPECWQEIFAVANKEILLDNIKLRNTIVEKECNQYAIILGNPPYFKLTQKLVKDMVDYDDILYGQPNIYSYFMYWAMQHLKKNGVMALIVPQSIRSGLYFKNLRLKMKSKWISALITIDSRQRIFDRAEQAVLIICIKNQLKKDAKTKIQFNNKNGEVVSSFKVDQTKILLDEQNHYAFVISQQEEMYNILNKISTRGVHLDSSILNLKFSNGLFVWNQHKDDIVTQTERAIPIIYGCNIQPLLFDFTKKSPNKNRKQYAYVTKKTRTFRLAGKRLLIQRTTNFEKKIRLKACIISDDFLIEHENYFLENHVNFLCSANGKEEILTEQMMYFYLGILNSKLLNFVFISKSGNTQVSANELNNLWYPICDQNVIAEFMINHIDDLERFQKDLDKLVCEAYQLSDEETEFIINC